MTTKDYFYQVQNAIRSRKNLQKLLPDLDEQMSAIGSFEYDKEKVQTTPQNARELKVCEYIDIKTKYIEQINRCARLIIEAEERLNGMSKPEYAEILRLQYMSETRAVYSEIAQIMDYSEDYVRRINTEASREFEEKYL